MTNKTGNIFLFTILTLTTLLVSCSNQDNKKISTTTTTVTNINDTIFLKSIKWDSLNSLVDYHIIHIGNRTVDTNFYYIVNPIASYHYFNNKMESSSDSTIKLKVNELKEFILSDSFAGAKEFECLVRINSQIGFHYRPELIQNIIVRAKDMSSKSIQSLMTALKKENFTQDIKSEAVEPTSLDKLMHNNDKIVFIKIKLKQDYWGVKKINEICNQLNTRPNIDTAFFNNLFAGLNEGEIIYHLTTEKKSSR